MKQKIMMVGKNYKAAPGAPFDKKKVQVYGRELNKIEQKNGRLTPTDVVEEARDSSSPLHEVFEWDNTEAAERWRLQQARQLINHITVPIEYNNSVKEQRAWLSVKDSSTSEDTEEPDKVYVNIQRVLNEKPLREQLLLSAIEEAEYWREKYTQYKELNRIFTSIKVTKKAIEKKLKVKKK